MKSINTIYVVGGGSAGAMTACTLKKFFPRKDIRILEGRDIPVVGVGESTLGQINGWLNLMGIEDKDWMKECNASYKLSIRFEDFLHIGDGGFHYPFGSTNFAKQESLAGLNDWYFKKFIYPETPNSDYADCIFPAMSLVNQNKITNKEIFPNYSFKRDVAYHFDAIKFGNWLKEKFFRKIGGRILQENIRKIYKNDDGSIKSVELDTGNFIEADLWIDCTGFNSLFLGKSLEEPFENYENILPNNSAWATRLQYFDKEKELKPYTNCTAYNHGWIWDIPLWSRKGTGYVYSDRYVTDEEALREFKNYLIIKNPKMTSDVFENLEFKKLKMRVGIHKRLWVKNVCAIGLSGGFIEPLESNGLLTVHEWLTHLIEILKKPIVNEFAKTSFNMTCKRMFRGFAEFVALHYALSNRTDTEYWKDIQKREYSIEQFNFQEKSDFQRAVIEKMEVNHYDSIGGFHCIATGMNWYPTSIERIKYALSTVSENDLKKQWQPYIEKLNIRKQKWKKLADKCPTLYQFLKENIYNDTDI
jgi:tryptophan halogenase